MTQGRMSYHLRRLRLHGLIERIPHTNRYQITDFGLRAAVFLTRVYSRFIAGAIAEIADRHLSGADPPSLRRAIDNLDAELYRHARRSGLAA
jgi:DNA-binding transcriptional ArsR family regulator